MNQQFGKQAFDQAEKLFKDARVPENVQAIAQQGVAASKEFYAKTAAAAQDGAKVMTEIADTAWGSTKLLNEKIVQNLTANAEAAFTAAQAMATAKSLPELAKLQGEFVQKFAAQASEQTKEFFDLSTRATQHLFEKAQAADSQVVQAHALNALSQRAGIETAAEPVAVFLLCYYVMRTHRPDASVAPCEDVVTHDHTKPEAERHVEPKTRPCLVCKTPFQSEWSGERVCRRCKSGKIWRSGGVTTQRGR